ncbi:transcriptional regulator [Bacillus sp. FJAT-18017]|uniref:helix-turn-helix domain-containing protein n=1 Tax=Bacillus sp. FJAT-18017 TaxID=1705566 RepID=UPI0006AFECB6|nr:helix-turn-helix domain-containing protein [Bacillus sp. FJAT-18017]ALC90197.1 transcriptional regulator [Bacillus sp. FJAT-18017]
MLGSRIKELRELRGYSISELAKLADVSKSYLSQIERGMQTNPSLQVLNKVAITLGTTIEYLLCNEGKAPQTEVELDKEWKELILTAIKEGMRKEDFMEYCKYTKYESWKKERQSVNEDVPK